MKTVVCYMIPVKDSFKDSAIRDSSNSPSNNIIIDKCHF